MKTAGQRLEIVAILGVTPGFERHDESCSSALETLNRAAGAATL
ncbi:MAG TPA: hypothetical protein PKC97_11780 [Burkholderiaceae bacterium]|nr:hypothetical protein [Burkholderiaceae bacterium]